MLMALLIGYKLLRNLVSKLKRITESFICMREVLYMIKRESRIGRLRGDLGRITEDGFIAKKSAIVLAVPVADLEYGASSWAFLKHISLIMIYRFTFV